MKRNGASLMKILALEFSSPRRSVAVLDGAKILAEQVIPAGQGVPPLRLIADALAEARVEQGEVGCVAVGIGPGSYNGIRSAIALAQGWQLSGCAKLLGVSSVECIAAQAQEEKLLGGVDVVIDAQRNEFYLASYEIGSECLKNLSGLKIVTLTELQSEITSESLAIGPEVTKWLPNGRVIFPGAATLGRLAAARGDFVSGEQLEPIYFRATSFVKASPPRSLEFKL